MIGCQTDMDFCVNTYGSYECVRFSTDNGEGMAQGLKSDDGSSDVSKTVSTMGNTVGTMQVSLIVMVVWVIIVTIALVAVGTVSFKKWRRDNFLEDGVESSIDPNEEPEEPEDRSRNGYESDESLSVSLDMPASNKDVHKVQQNGTTSQLEELSC